MATKITLLSKWLLVGAVMADPRLSPTDAAVLFTLLDFLNCKTGRCDPNVWTGC